MALSLSPRSTKLAFIGGGGKSPAKRKSVESGSDFGNMGQRRWWGSGVRTVASQDVVVRLVVGCELVLRPVGLASLLGFAATRS